MLGFVFCLCATAGVSSGLQTSTEPQDGPQLDTGEIKTRFNSQVANHCELPSSSSGSAAWAPAPSAVCSSSAPFPAAAMLLLFSHWEEERDSVS